MNLKITNTAKGERGVTIFYEFSDSGEVKSMIVTPDMSTEFIKDILTEELKQRDSDSEKMDKLIKDLNGLEITLDAKKEEIIK